MFCQMFFRSSLDYFFLTIFYIANWFYFSLKIYIVAEHFINMQSMSTEVVSWKGVCVCVKASWWKEVWDIWEFAL